MMFSIIIWALLLLFSQGQPCMPKYLLSEMVHDTVTINSFNATGSSARALYTYNYFQNLFSKELKVVLSVNELVSHTFTLLNYQISAQIQPSSLNFYFTSKNMSWTSMQVQFLLHSRADIYSHIQTISILNTQQNTTVQYPIANSKADTTFVVAHFIVGVIAMASEKYVIGIRPFSVGTSRYQIAAYSNVQAALTIQTVFVDSKQHTLSYSFNQYAFPYKADAQYYTLWADFAPNIYTIFGFSRINFKGNGFQIKSNFNIVGNLFTIDTMTGTQGLSLTYFSIGQLPEKVCSPCNNFISVQGCLDVCPNNSYPQSLSKGGKTCRKCNPMLGQTILSSNSCTCPNGQIYYKGNCYKVGDIPPNCSNNEVLVSNKCVLVNRRCTEKQEVFQQKTSTCVCKPNFQRFSGICTEMCPQNSKRESKGICICASGFLMNANKKCQSLCTANSYFEVRTSKCLCNPNFQMKKGLCVACQSNQAYDAPSRQCVAKSVTRVGVTNSVVTIICQPNEIIVNGVCVCSQESIRSNNKCVECQEGTYRLNERQCAQCGEYCSNCKSKDSCLQCNFGFQSNNKSVCSEICGDGRKFVLPCDDGNINNDDGCSSTCQIQRGFVCNGGNKNNPDVCKRIAGNTNLSISIAATPAYISAGIITEFIVQPPIQRSREELYSLFKLTFSKETLRPKIIFLSQSETDYRSIRCFFDYNNALPNGFFKTQFVVTDQVYGRSTISIMYNTFSNPIQSAIKYLQDRHEEDILS